MAYPPYDYTARRSIPDALHAGYRAGDGLYQQVADDLGLVLGVDIDAARTDLMERPAETAKRAEWVQYVLTQEPGTDRDELDDLSRPDLIARVSKPAPAKKTAAKTADKEAPSDSGA